jgi:protoporphyrinogen oxidase
MLSQSKNKSLSLVLGGGISGLTAGRVLQKKGLNCLLLEQCPSLGGLTRTVEVGRFCFDYTGHFLHLKRYNTPAGVPFAALNNDDWELVNRRAYCFVANKLITSPIQYNLSELPPAEFEACLRAYDQRPSLPTEGEISFRQFIVSGFGQYLADIFLIPQNEKTMAFSLDRLSNRAIKRFFPPPDEQRIRAGMRGEESPQEYNSRFWYPKKGGIERLVHGIAAGLQNVRVNQQVVEVDLDRRLVRTRSGETFAFDQMFTSIPLLDFCRICNDPELVRQAASLSHSSTICINIGIRGPVAASLQDVHWVYVPDRNIPFYRVGCYSNISAGTCSVGYHALYVEVGVEPEKIDDINLINNLEPRVFKALVSLGWLDPKRVVCTATHVIRCAYVHHTPQRDATVNEIKQRLAEAKIYPIGRYGLWDYTSMEDSILSAITAVERSLS